MANKNFEVKHGLSVGGTERITSAGAGTLTDLTLSGNLTVQGTSTTLNTATLDVEDKNITLNKGSGDTSGTAGGAGITIQDGVNASTDATILWDASDDEFDFSHAINIPGLKISGTAPSNGQVVGYSSTAGLEWTTAGPTFKTFGTGSIMIGDTTTGTINAADNNTGIGVDVFAALTSGDGNVAIGKSALTANTTGSYNIAIGLNTLDANTTGTQNIAMGLSTLGTNTSGSFNTAIGVGALTANTTASNNTALGFNSLAANTIGTQNTAVGDSSLDANTEGENNTAVGHMALGANTTADNNTSIGSFSLDANTTGANNTAVGKSSLGANTTGVENNAFGVGALQSNTTGYENCAFGRGSLANNTTANHNSAFGDETLGLNTTGTRNVAIGNKALRWNTTANDNVAVGHEALGNNSTGSDNTAVGYGAGDSNTTGQRNVYIGIDAGASGTTNSENCLVGRKAGQLNTASAITALGTESLYNNTGSDNTGIGAAALNANTSGAYNTALGRSAGSSMTTPTYNTMVGYGAGQGSHPLLTGSSCTMVGALARPSGTLGNANGENVFGFNMSANGTNTTTLGSGGSGLYATHGSNGWAAISDERYKKDIVDSEVGLSFINDLRPRNFKWKTCGEVPNDTPRYEEDSNELIHPNLTGVMHGFIAQEVKAVIDNHSEVPNNQLIWKQDPDGIQGLAEGELIPALVKAIQELSARVKELEG